MAFRSANRRSSSSSATRTCRWPPRPTSGRNIPGDHRVKFKCQALPLKDRLGGIRVLFSHNVQFPRSSAAQNLTATMETMTTIFPVLQRLKKTPDEKIQLVSETIVEEVLQDIGLLDFGKGITAKTNVSLWRTRGEHRPLIGEFAFQIRFKDRKELAREAMQRAEASSSRCNTRLRTGLR